MSVTPVPMTKATMIVRGRIMKLSRGRSRLKTLLIQRRRYARPSPAANPRAEDARPTTTASPMTVAVIWRPVVPRARKRPNSLTRCPSKIVNVLKITKTDIPRMMNPKASKAF